MISGFLKIVSEALYRYQLVSPTNIKLNNVNNHRRVPLTTKQTSDILRLLLHQKLSPKGVFC